MGAVGDIGLRNKSSQKDIKVSTMKSQLQLGMQQTTLKGPVQKSLLMKE